MTNSVTNTPQVAKAESSGIARAFRSNIQTYAIIIALLAIWIFFAFLTDGNYLKPQNFSNIFRQMTVTGLMAIGMVLVIVSGNIDLSVGKLAGFVSVVVAYFQAEIWTEVIPNQPILAATLSHRSVCGYCMGHFTRVDYFILKCTIFHCDVRQHVYFEWCDSFGDTR
jgi:ABC-type xylose transport system permease subunit